MQSFLYRKLTLQSFGRFEALRRPATVILAAFFLTNVFWVCHQSAAREVTEGHIVVESSHFGFLFEHPQDWQRDINASGSLVIFGPSGTPAEQAIMVLQILAKSELPPTSDIGELTKVFSQIKKQPDWQLLNEGRMPIAGMNAPFFQATYLAEDERGNMTNYRHFHLVMDHEDHFFLLSYRSPAGIFETFQSVFAHAIATFSFPLSKEEKQKLNRPGTPLATLLKGLPLKVVDGVYVSNEFGYRVDVPRGWSAEHQKGGSTIQIYPKERNAAVFVFAIATDHDMPLDKWISISEDKVLPKFTFLQKKIEGIEPVALNLDGGATMVIHRYEGHHMNKPVESYTGHISHNNVIYIVSMFAEVPSATNLNHSQALSTFKSINFK